MSLEEKVLPKIEQDIEIILAKGWADAISPQDLYHCHILIPMFFPVGYERLISAEAIQILYHSREFQGITYNRNILSDLSSSPRTDNRKKTLYPFDLNCWESCQINFGLSKEDLNFHKYKFDRVVQRGKYYFGFAPYF